MNRNCLMTTLKRYPFKSARRMQNGAKGNDRIPRWIANRNTWMETLRLDASPITSTSSATTVQLTTPESLANENVFKTTDDLLTVSVQNQLQALEGQKILRETLREYLSPLSRKYVEAILTGDKKSNMYGVYLDRRIEWHIGSKRFDVKNNIIINGVWYIGTPGFYEWSSRESSMTSSIRRTISKSTKACYWRRMRTDTITIYEATEDISINI